MALDVYLHIEGIKGESTDAAHRGWIEVRLPKAAYAH